MLNLGMGVDQFKTALPSPTTGLNDSLVALRSRYIATRACLSISNTATRDNYFLLDMHNYKTSLKVFSAKKAQK